MRAVRLNVVAHSLGMILVMGCSDSHRFTADTAGTGGRDGVGPEIAVIEDVPSGPRCRRNEECDDRMPCTIDECNFGTGECMHRTDIYQCMCDPNCHTEPSGMGGRMFDPAGGTRVAFDMAAGGLVVPVNESREDLLWVPNTGESTVSKWDAVAEREVARYRVGLPQGECRGRCCYENGCNQVSRVVVDGFGNVFAASRGFGMQGTVSKIAAARSDCIDRNMNGMIETSSGPMDVLPYGADECVLWTAAVGPVNAVLRSIAIDLGDESIPEGNVWVGACGDVPAGLFMLNPRSGVTAQRLDFPRCAYGAVVTPDGILWQHSRDEGITPVDPFTGRVGPFQRSGEGVGGNGATYGITADLNGRIWLSRAGIDAYGYDPQRRQWTWADLQSHPRGGEPTGLGITVDASNHVWVAGPTVAYEWHADDFNPGGTMQWGLITVHRFAAIPGFASVSAIGADRRGQIWLASSEPGPLVKLDPATNVARAFDGPNRVYSYSDFTGAVRRLATGLSTYRETYSPDCAASYAEFSWQSTTPMGSSLQFSLQTASTRAGLDTARVVPLAAAPRDTSPVDVQARLLAAGVLSARYARITVTFSLSAQSAQSPVLSAMALSWRCPP